VFLRGRKDRDGARRGGMMGEGGVDGGVDDERCRRGAGDDPGNGEDA
jgi:hypothetical protein